MVKTLSIWITIFSINSSVVLAAGNIQHRKFDRILKRKHIGKEFSTESFDSLITFLDKELSRLKHKFGRAKARKDDKAMDDLKPKLSLLKFAIKKIDDVKDLKESDPSKDKYFYLAKRIYYTISSEPYEPKNSNLQMLWEALLQINTHLKYKKKSKLDDELNENEVVKESKFLVDPHSGITFTNPSELAGMSTQQISNLDIEDDHPLWNTHSYMKEHPNPWARMEKWVEDNYTEVLLKNEKELKDTKFRYNLKDARRILFFTKIKDSDSNAKANAKDRFGIKWKVKWGGETHSEPVANRLYLKAGGKINDLVYSNDPGGENFLFILEDPNESGKKCDDISSVKVFIKCMRKSVYKMDVSPYIKESGVIKKSNYQRLFGDNYLTVKKKYSLKKLMGREYILFNEVSVEFKGEQRMKKGGPTPFSSMGGLKDRAIRSLSLFDLWIHNIDARDPNNRGLLIKNFQDGFKGYQYVESQHDLGSSMGAITKPVELNKLKIGPKFVELQKSGPAGPRLRFEQFTLFRPKSWLKATHADLWWMARHLNRIDYAFVKSAVKATHLPDFVREVYAYRLYRRLLDILVIYGLRDKSEIDELPIPNVSIALSTPQDRLNAAIKYNIPLSEIETVMYQRKILKKEIPVALFEDVVVRKGKIWECDDSIIIGLLEKHVYPTGIDRRVFRYFDNRPLKECKFDDSND
ncbi:MAG: hypothetical protein HOE90_14980 [Bacteriovoracaceae bacterium]|jgi:hypothetical protein|nr:hypothetical protein [Bacteriovoracaceae bacterium]